ncbi:MAG: TolC family protein, partial [Planctomycetales bacterium]|nr:TolC family protein [Planctomycetales bacterium]
MSRGSAALLVLAALAGCAGLPDADLAPWPAGSSVPGWPARGGKPLAGETFRVDLPTVLRLSGASPIEVGLVRERIAAAEAERAMALQSFLPYATLGGGYARLDGLTQGTSGDLQNVDKQSFHFAARGVLEWDLGRSVFATLAAAQRVDAARDEGEARRRDVARDAAEAYLDLSLASAEAEIHRRSLEIAERLRTQVEAAVEAGRGFRGDVLRARTRAAHHRLGVERAEERRRTVGVRLATLLRLDPEVTLLPSDSRPVPVSLVPEGTPAAALVEKALRERPEIRAAG